MESGARVTVLDDLFTGRRDAIPTGAEFIEGSVTDESLVRDLVKRHTVVFHMAARNIIASTNKRTPMNQTVDANLTLNKTASEL